MSENFALRVRLYGPYRESAEADEIRVDLARGSTVADLLTTLTAGALGGMVGAAVAVNRKYAPADTILDPGDEVAIIPPVAGG